MIDRIKTYLVDRWLLWKKNQPEVAETRDRLQNWAMLLVFVSFVVLGLSSWAHFRQLKVIESQYDYIVALEENDKALRDYIADWILKPTVITLTETIEVPFEVTRTVTESVEIEVHVPFTVTEKITVTQRPQAPQFEFRRVGIEQFPAHTTFDEDANVVKTEAVVFDPARNKFEVTQWLFGQGFSTSELWIVDGNTEGLPRLGEHILDANFPTENLAGSSNSGPWPRFLKGVYTNQPVGLQILINDRNEFRSEFIYFIIDDHGEVVFLERTDTLDQAYPLVFGVTQCRDSESCHFVGDSNDIHRVQLSGEQRSKEFNRFGNLPWFPYPSP